MYAAPRKIDLKAATMETLKKEKHYAAQVIWELLDDPSRIVEKYENYLSEILAEIKRRGAGIKRRG